MAGLVKVLAAKPADLRSVPETHMVGGEDQFSKLSSDLHMYTLEYTGYTHK